MHNSHSSALTTEAAKTLVQAFISCRLDYCNSLLCGVAENVTRRVQSLQNAAARLITGARRRDHITPVLCQLHWLLFGGEWSSNSPVWCARHCAVKCLRTWLMISISSPKATDDPFGLVCGAMYGSGDRSFGAVGPRIWNSLPCGLRTLDISYKHFKTLVKTLCLTRPRRFVTL